MSKLCCVFISKEFWDPSESCAETHLQQNAYRCITQSFILCLSLRLKPSTMDVLRNPLLVVCISSGFPNQSCRPMRLLCFSRSPPSLSLSWKATLWRTWWALWPPNHLMFPCGLKSQVCISVVYVHAYCRNASEVEKLFHFILCLGLGLT